LQLQQQLLLRPQSFANVDLIRTPTQPFYYLAYIPSYTAFIDHSDQNSFDHDVSGSAQIVLQRLAFGAFARFQTFRLPEIDVGTRTAERLTSARTYAIYASSDRTQLNADVFMQNRDFQSQSLISSFELWNEDWLDYRYSTKTNVGAGATAGLVIPSTGPQQYYGRLHARATWSPTGKISVAAKAGLELREVSGRGSRFYPVFGLEGRYAITARTSAAVSAYQLVRASADQQALVYFGRGLDIRIEQKILDRYRLTAAVGYSNTEYDDSFAQIPGGIARTDNFFFVNSSLQVGLNRWVDSQVGIEFRENDSSRAGLSFNEALASWTTHFKF
jgi:hypothetical protein